MGKRSYRYTFEYFSFPSSAKPQICTLHKSAAPNTKLKVNIRIQTHIEHLFNTGTENDHVYMTNALSSVMFHFTSICRTPHLLDCHKSEADFQENLGASTWSGNFQGILGNDASFPRITGKYFTFQVTCSYIHIHSEICPVFVFADFF